ncbi:MAG: phosphoenolpyruvate--protein phosphotransferase [Alphaproteobacteria bacterium]|nr:phosphoenolpyruvate--protein phosphotransferase [Alphaproteobacteria bacterium]
MTAEIAPWTGSRRLLRSLRDVMAGPGTPQQRLDQIATLIARDLVAEVCSIYVRRAGDILELFATEGLYQDAVHRTRLMVGEGLIGFIAAQAMPIALADAQAHPLFAYRPETGEESYSSLMGVPILRGGRVIGVLAVQNRTQRSYADEEVEILETIAMVLAELVAGGDVISPEEASVGQDLGALPQRLEGLSLSPGLARGTAILHRPRVTIDRMLSDDPAHESERVLEAVAAVHGQLDAILERPDLSDAGEHRDVLEAYRMFAHDRGWLRRIEEAVRTGLSAEAAVQRVQDDTRARMAQVSDTYLRERLLDFEDLTNRLLRNLTDDSFDDNIQLPHDTVLVARSLGPAELLNYDQTRLRAIVLEEGSTTAHATIVARALDVPMVGRVEGLLSRVETGDAVLVDGDNAVVYLRPSDDVHANFDAALDARGERLRSYRGLRDRPAITKDGVSVSLQLNAGLLAEMNHLYDTGAAGVGLFRTEIPFMVRAAYPDVATQTEFYRRVIQEADGLPVTFRTLDIGGDKVLPYIRAGEEANPAMGWRATRIALDRPAMLRHQLRALLMANDGGALSVMFPMIAQVAEFDAARRLLDMEVAYLRERGLPLPDDIRVGVMLEVPALAMQLATLLPRVDFVSIGSNDLVQFLFASDRGNPRLEGRYDPLSPAVLTFIAQISEACRAANMSLTVCGEMAGDPLAAMALIGIGIRELSMSPANIGPVKAMTLSLDLATMSSYLETLLTSSAPSIRSRLKAFAHDHGIVL